MSHASAVLAMNAALSEFISPLVYFGHARPTFIVDIHSVKIIVGHELGQLLSHSCRIFLIRRWIIWFRERFQSSHD